MSSTTHETGTERRIACEKAYRRGYAQGVKAALAWLYGTLPLTPELDVVVPDAMNQSEQWEQRLDEWRKSVDERGSMVVPPAVEEENDGSQLP